MTGRIASFFLSIILTLLGWIPGVIHACLVVNDYHAEQRGAAHFSAAAHFDLAAAQECDGAGHHDDAHDDGTHNRLPW